VQSPGAALALAQHVDRTAGVRLDGLFFYPGQIWSPPDQQAALLEPVAARVAETLDLWRRHGLEAGIVSGGSTPTAYQSHLIGVPTEIRPGTYVYNDMNTVLGGFCELDDCAARIVCTVVSTAVPGKVVLDAGTKTLTSDRNATRPDSGHGRIVAYPQAKIVRLSEEHGEVDVTACDRAPKLGERVHVIPNHICPCVNLQDAAWWRQPDGMLEPLPIDARGRLA
jgi:D-serine deaminase-like pyridoxal phosphate-dependent protein